MKRRKYNGRIYIGKGIRARKKEAGILRSVALRKVFISLLIMGVLVVFLFGSKRYASAQPKFITNFQELELSGGEIYWASKESKKIVQKSIEDSIRVPLGDKKYLSLLEADAVKKVYKALCRSPWVSRIWEVKKKYPNKVVARFEVRKPEIAVIAGDFIVPLDKNGVILPLIFTPKRFENFNKQLNKKLRLVVGLNANIVETYDGNISVKTDNDTHLYCGEIWDDLRISSALIVNQSLDTIKKDKDFKKLNFIVISVENIGGSKNVLASDIIISAQIDDGRPSMKKNYVSIWWGRDKVHAGYGENKVSDKIEMLRMIIKKKPKLKNISKIDLRFPNAELEPTYQFE